MTAHLREAWRARIQREAAPSFGGHWLTPEGEWVSVVGHDYVKGDSGYQEVPAQAQMAQSGNMRVRIFQDEVVVEFMYPMTQAQRNEVVIALDAAKGYSIQVTFTKPPYNPVHNGGGFTPDDVDKELDLAQRAARQYNGTGVAATKKQAGPGGGVIPWRVRYQGPIRLNQPRPVKLDPMAIHDFKEVLYQDEQRKAKEAIEALEAGHAPLEPKTRELTGTYGIRVDEDCRLLAYPHIDGSWHVMYLGRHDYDEATRRWANPPDMQRAAASE